MSRYKTIDVHSIEGTIFIPAQIYNRCFGAYAVCLLLMSYCLDQRLPKPHRPLCLTTRCISGSNNLHSGNMVRRELHRQPLPSVWIAFFDAVRL